MGRHIGTAPTDDGQKINGARPQKHPTFTYFRIMKKLIIIPLLLILASCARTVDFTQSMRADLERNGVDLKEVQFYVSDGFTLKNINVSTTRTYETDEHGVISVKKGEQFSSIGIRKNTMGRCLEKPDSHTLGISFEYEKYLCFESNRDEVGAYEKRYYLRSDVDEDGKPLRYSDSYEDYIVKTEDPVDVWLKVKKKRFAILTENNYKVLKGRKVTNQKSN